MQDVRTIDLKGTWKLALLKGAPLDEITPQTLHFDSAIQLPGSLEESNLGESNTKYDEPDRFSTEHIFEGTAVFQKEFTLPESWSKQRILLELERTRMSKVWLDGSLIGGRDRCCVPHRFELSKSLKTELPLHLLQIAVDNRADAWIPGSSHMCTPHTQGNWNGLLGNLRITSTPKVWIESATPTFKQGKLVVDLLIGNDLNEKQSADLQVSISSRGKEHSEQQRYIVSQGIKKIQFHLKTDALPQWDEFTPELCVLKAEIKAGDTIHSIERTIGLVDFKVAGKHFSVNGKTIFLRGKHDACVFPLTGYAPMEEEPWLRYMSIMKDYGFNHFRCHTWCPPEAAFAAADKLGIYIQAELPSWWALAAAENKMKVKDPNAAAFAAEGKETVEFNPAIRTDAELYLLAEAKAILDEYGHHPSFRMLSLGNELHGSVPVMKRMVDELREYDAGRRLFIQGSNNHFADPKPGESDDCWVTVRTSKKTWDSTDNTVRMSFCFVDQRNGGLINDARPNSNSDFSKAVEPSPLPVISHETGQYQFYPDYKSLGKFTGVMKPWNLLKAKKLLEEKGMAELAEDFFKASGELAALLYKEDVEALLRTKDLAGFQMLDLQDFPGQGTALVGLLDAFLDSKGFVTPEEWRRSCSDKVLLGLLPKFTFAAGDELSFTVKIANYGSNALPATTIKWNLAGLATGTIQGPSAPQGHLTEVAEIRTPLPHVEKACCAKLELQELNSGLRQEYRIWIYPDAPESHADIILTRHLTPALLGRIERGAKAILHPDHAAIESWSFDPLFTTEYWSYSMFKKIALKCGVRPSPGTMGLLIDETHPALADFPTDFHSAWQWWGIVRQGRPMEIDDAPKGFKPIVQTIDSFWRSEKLGLLYEFRIGEGALLVSGVDLDGIKNCVEGRAFRTSLIRYAAGGKFSPKTVLPSGSPLLERLKKS